MSFSFCCCWPGSRAADCGWDRRKISRRKSPWCSGSWWDRDRAGLTVLFSSHLILFQVLTVPAQYLTAYFTFWQTSITQVDSILGILLLVVQLIQLSCAFIGCLPNRHKICFNPFETDWEKIHWHKPWSRTCYKISQTLLRFILFVFTYIITSRPSLSLFCHIHG